MFLEVRIALVSLVILVDHIVRLYRKDLLLLEYHMNLGYLLDHIVLLYRKNLFDLEDRKHLRHRRILDFLEDLDHLYLLKVRRVLVNQLYHRLLGDRMGQLCLLNHLVHRLQLGLYPD